MLSCKTFNFVSAGRLVDVKDHLTLIKAFSVLCRENHQCRLYILGEGKLEKKLLKIISELGIKDNVSLLGFRHNIFDYFASADCFVLTSKSEAFGNVIVEAMAFGIPIIATDCPSGPREILDGGRYGMLVKVGDYKTLAFKMSLMLDINIHHKYSLLSLERAIFFNIVEIGQKYLDIITNIKK